MFGSMKWIWVILLVIVGAFFTYMAVTYFTVSLGHLPHWFPGHKAIRPGHHERGHYRKGGAASALLALIAFVAAGWIGFHKPRSAAPAATTTPAAGTADAAGTVA
jgi:hypothetical protein